MPDFNANKWGDIENPTTYPNTTSASPYRANFYKNEAARATVDEKVKELKKVSDKMAAINNDRFARAIGSERKDLEPTLEANNQLGKLLDKVITAVEQPQPKQTLAPILRR